MTNYKKGHDAEKQAAKYLQKKSFKILDLNWATRFCEIDIVAAKDNVVYFVEVKYRQSDVYGDGLDYITSKKLRQMTRAAETWLHAHSWTGESTLAGLSITGDVIKFIEIS